MKSARIALATTAVMLVAACGSGGSNPEPKTTTLFVPVAKYTIDAKVGANQTERVTLTVGKPIPAAEYRKADTTLACPLGNDDAVVPLAMALENTSPPGGPQTGFGIMLRPALDLAQMKSGTFAMAVQDADGKKCAQLFPLNNITNDPAIEGTATNPFGMWQPGVKPGTLYDSTPHIFLTGGGVTVTPSTSLFFLRLTPSKDDEAQYTITKVTASKVNANNKVVGPVSAAAVVTGGKTKGAFYVPLDGVTNPCTTLGRNAPMLCGAEVNAPK